MGWIVTEQAGFLTMWICCFVSDLILCYIFWQLAKPAEEEASQAEEEEDAGDVRTESWDEDAEC